MTKQQIKLCWPTRKAGATELMEFKSESWEKADISDQAAKQRKQFFSSIFPFSPGLEELNAAHQY